MPQRILIGALAFAVLASTACGAEKKEKSKTEKDDDDDDDDRASRKKKRSTADASSDGQPGPGKLAPQPAASFTLTGSSFKTAEPIDVTFNRPLIPPEGQQWWITLIEASKPDTEWGSWHYVPNGAITDKLVGAVPGDYEVRLYDLHPANPGRVLARQRVSVVQCKAASDCSAAGATCDAGRCSGAPLPLQPPPPPPPPPPTPEPPPPPPPQSDYLADGWPAVFPPTGSKAPSLAEWAAVPREVTVRNSTNLRCETKMLREWLRVSCKTNDFGVPIAVSLAPAFGQQSFKFLVEGSVASTVSQMIPGKNFGAHYTWSGQSGDVTFTLTVSWVNGRPVASFNVPDD